MATLVADLDETITCAECGRVCPARMQSCPGCLALLRPGDVDAEEGDGLARALAGGLRLHRPAARTPFAMGPACTVLRLRPQAGLVLCGADGLIEANLAGPGIRARPPLHCTTDGITLFRLDVYEAADAALVAVGADGAPLATYLRHGGPFTATIDIRDETSAPVARFEPVPHGVGFRIVETGGRALGWADRTDVEDRSWIDDQWSVTPTASELPILPLAFVALAVAAKVLLGRPEPVRMRDPKEGAAADLEDVLGPISKTIVGGFFT